MDAIRHGSRGAARESTPAHPGPTSSFRPAVYVTPLKELCVAVIAKNFEQRPDFGKIPAIYREKATEQLSLDLPLEMVGALIDDENYWRRRSTARWHNCEPSLHGLSWKQLYFERNLENVVEHFDPTTSDVNTLRRLVAFSRRYITQLNIRQLPSHLDLTMLLNTAQGAITGLTITYGLKDVGMDYDRELFGMKLSDCRLMAQAVAHSETLTLLSLTGNALDDEKVRMLASGLLENITITHLDISHNLVGDRGARALAKCMASPKCVLAVLDLRNNRVGTEGGRFLAKALQSNITLMYLNLRLNRLGDDGAGAILEALKSNGALQRLNLAGNSLGDGVTEALADMLASNRTLCDLDLSANPLGPDCGPTLRDAVEANRVLKQLDVRMANLGAEAESGIVDLMRARSDAVAFASAKKA